MTMPFERKSAVNQTRDFLYSLIDPKRTPRVPKYVRERARSLLKHYPSSYYMDEASLECPDIFGEFKVEQLTDD